MSVQQRTKVCWTVSCDTDGCDSRPSTDEWVYTHHDSMEEALAEAREADWLVETDPLRILCEVCVEEQDETREHVLRGDR